MPKLTVAGIGTFDVPQGKRLILALEEDAGIPVMHSCGGNARCTTCRVKFLAGEPHRMTLAEQLALELSQTTGVRLSCQILCEQDMTVCAINRHRGSGRPDPTTKPAPELHPQPVEWMEVPVKPPNQETA